MQVVITAAGKGNRFKQAGYKTDKILIPFLNKPAILNVLDSFPAEWTKILVVAEDFESLAELKNLISNSSDIQLISSKYSPLGPIETVKAALPYLKLSEPVLVTYGDVALDWNPHSFKKQMRPYDFGFINYSGFHPTYLGPNSYCHVKLNFDQTEVIEIGEKKRFQTHLQDEITSAGYYYFKSAALLADGLMIANLHKKNVSQTETKSDDINKRFQTQASPLVVETYTSHVIQFLKNQNSKFKIGHYQINHLLQMGTPEDKARADLWQHYFCHDPADKSLKLSDLAANNIETFTLEKNYWKRIFAIF